MMMGMMDIGVSSARSANYFVPLMIAPGRIGLPRIRGDDLLAADGRRLHPGLDDLLRRLSHRLDGYERSTTRRSWAWTPTPSSLRSVGSDGPAGLNMMATIITMARARADLVALPIFVWSVFATRDPDGSRRTDADRGRC